MNAASSDSADASVARHRKVHNLKGQSGFRCQRCAGVFRVEQTHRNHLSACKHKEQTVAAAAAAHADRSAVSQQQSRPAPTKKAEPAAAAATQPQALVQLGGSQQAQPSTVSIAAVVAEVHRHAQGLWTAPVRHPIFAGAFLGLIPPELREGVCRQTNARWSQCLRAAAALS